jgi:hypothetical protein
MLGILVCALIKNVIGSNKCADVAIICLCTICHNSITSIEYIKTWLGLFTLKCAHKMTVDINLPC